jgi:hypothetical protein
LSQIPPQRIYAGATCTAPIPNYLTKITASDNCEVASFTQTPAAGTLLTPTNKTATIVVKATDASGNFRQLTFIVTLLDTIKPVLTIDPSLLVLNYKQINDIYNFGDKLVWYAEQQFDSTFPYDSLKIKDLDSLYFKRQMIIYTDPAFALTGQGRRVWTFK